jgi:hypothetical protein
VPADARPREDDPGLGPRRPHPEAHQEPLADPKQQKYLVNVDDVVAVAEQVARAPAETSDKLELQHRAQERAAQVLAARAAKGR